MKGVKYIIGVVFIVFLIHFYYPAGVNFAIDYLPDIMPWVKDWQYHYFAEFGCAISAVLGFTIFYFVILPIGVNTDKDIEDHLITTT